MTVIEFEPRRLNRRTPRGWRAEELEQLQFLFKAYADQRGAASWETGATEADDPQFYVLGPEPDEDCLVSVTRLGPAYVLEDGRGTVLARDVSLSVLVATAIQQLRPGRAHYVSRLLAALWAGGHAIEERAIILLEEGPELLSRFAPQLLALA